MRIDINFAVIPVWVYIVGYCLAAYGIMVPYYRRRWRREDKRNWGLYTAELCKDDKQGLLKAGMIFSPLILPTYIVGTIVGNLIIRPISWVVNITTWGLPK